MLSSGCDDSQIPYASPRGSPDKKTRSVSSRRGSLHLAHGEKFYPAGIPPHPDISHPDGKGGHSVRRHLTFGYLTAGWERRTLQLLQIDISGPSDNAYLQSFSLSIQCSSVLLNLPDISDRYFEIFWDILL